MLAEQDYEHATQPPRLSWQSLYALAERAPFGIYIVDSHLRIALINAAAQQHAFRHVDPAEGRSLVDVVRTLWPQEIADAIVNEFRRTLATGAPYRSADYVHPRADSGALEAYEWELHRITLPDESFGVACYYYDTTELRKAEQVLRASEERYRTLFDMMKLGYQEHVIVRDESGRAVDHRIVATNAQLEALTGISREEALRKTVGELASDLAPCWLEAFERVVRSGQPEQIECDVPQFGRWYKAHAYPMGGDRFAVLYDDITERKQVEMALRASEERQAFLLRLIDTLRQLADPVAIQEAACRLAGEHLHAARAAYCEADADPAYVVVARDWACPGVASIAGRHRLGNFGSLFTGPLLEGECAIVEDCEHDPRVAPEQVATWQAAGIRAAIVYPIVKENRFVGGFFVHSTEARKWSQADVVLVRDVGERAWAAVERARAAEALRDADARKDEFLAMLAHELRNPLAAINNAGQILLRAGNDPKALRTTAEILNRQVNHMVRQVDDLLDMSRISRGKIELRKECVNLNKVATHAVESTRPFIEGAHHELSIALPVTAPYVLGDPVRLTQVVANLLNNAAKFTNRGGHIWLTLEQEGGEAVVRVRDNGIGISSDEQGRIFELFVQLDKSLGRVRDGLGLGLPLVRKLVEMHGGTVTVHSKGLTHGAEFVVRLPTLTSLLPPQPEEEPQSTPAPRRRVLVVDDNRDSADSLATLLSLMGHDVDTAHDGVEAVKKAVTFRPDLILLDIGMPRLNGYEAAQWIREQGHEKLTIVALTGWGQDEDRRLSREAGFDAHIVKPIELATLTKLLAHTETSWHSPHSEA